MAAYDADDYCSALSKLLPLAETGHAESQHIVAEMYRWGRGVDQNAQLCASFYKSAADQGHHHAAYFLAMLLYPVVTSAPAAMEACFKDRKAADHYLALALKWFKEVAETGDIDATSFLGFLYHSGIGVPMDGAESIRW